MRTPIRMPNLGTEATAGRIVAWRRGINDLVVSGDVVAELETDKATVELESPATGRIVEVIQPAGAEVPVGELLAVIDDE